MINETQRLSGLIEDAAVDARPDWDGQISLSVAISLKRIADRFDSVTTTRNINDVGNVSAIRTTDQL